jgi:hypothetical protein
MEPITPTEADKLEQAREVDHPPALLDREPVLVLILGGSLVPALIALLVAFGVTITETQTAALLGVVGAVTTVASALAARRRAFAPATVAKLLDRRP